MQKFQLMIQAEQGNDIARFCLERDDRPEYIPQKAKDLIKLRSMGVCAICKKPSNNGHIDHKQPVSRGGKCTFDNLQYLCRFCNLSKSNHALDQSSYEKGYIIPIYLPSENVLIRNILTKVDDPYA